MCVCVVGGGGTVAMNVDNKKEVTDLKFQCRDLGAPQLYEGKSHDHQRSLLQ